MTKRICILGGGITGLTCAYRLAKAGYEVVVYDEADQMGGLASSYVSGRFIFDYGPHEFCTENPILIETLKDLLDQELLVREKHAAQYFNDKYLPYPLGPFGIIRHLRPWLLCRIIGEVIFCRLKGLMWSYSDYSFERWVKSRFGGSLYKQYFGPYTRKVWGIDPDLLDPRTASNRISFNSICWIQ